MRRFGLGLALLSATFIHATAATSLYRSSFEATGSDSATDGWTVMGGGGALRVVRDPGSLLNGKPSLALDYEIGPGKLGVAILPLDAAKVAPEQLAKMDQIHFWVKTEFPATVVVVLSEKGGGNYTAMAWSPGNVWQEVRVEPRDFTLSDKATDPVDPDGKLDLDQIQGVGIADLGQILGAGKDAPRGPIVVDRHVGHHTLWLSGFELLAGNPPRTDNLAIDTFDAPQISWSSPGGASLRLDTSKEHAPGPALEASYNCVENALVFFSRNLPPGIPPGITHIAFDIAAEKSAQIVFSLQEKGASKGEGPRYNTTLEIRGGGKSDHRELALSALNLDANGPKDPDGALDITRAKSLAIADISANAGFGEGPNKIWLTNLRLIAKN